MPRDSANAFGRSGAFSVRASVKLVPVFFLFGCGFDSEAAWPEELWAVAGLVDKPVIAVPTSVGYGASMGGLAALLGMLNSCASGVTVVNIDNGFGAALAATLINRVGIERDGL